MSAQEIIKWYTLKQRETYTQTVCKVKYEANEREGIKMKKVKTLQRKL
jgi:hypothetical protein